MCLALVFLCGVSHGRSLCLAQMNRPDTRIERRQPNHPLEPEVSPFFRQAPARSPADKLPLQTTGTVEKVVLLIRFSNHRNRSLPDPSVYDTILNGENPHPEFAPLGSGAAYAREVSYGRLNLVCHVIPRWIDLPQTEQYYANGRSGGLGSRLTEALRYAVTYAEDNDLIDYSRFDRNRDSYVDVLTFIHSGYGAEVPALDPNGFGSNDRIWSHRSVISPTLQLPQSGMRVSDYAISAGLHGNIGTRPTRLGLLAHEAGHQGGLPDLYDTNREVGNNRGEGIGAWGLMGDGWGFDGTGLYPPHLSAFSKIASGWATVERLTESGTYEIRQSYENSTFYLIDAGFPQGEYILIENRQPVGFDQRLPGGVGGLAIWHVDMNKSANDDRGFPGQQGWPQNNRHYMVALLQADGRYDLEVGRNSGDTGDLYRAGHVDSLGPDSLPALRPYRTPRNALQYEHRISNISTSGPVMTFEYNVRARPPAVNVASAESGWRAANESLTAATSRTGTPARPSLLGTGRSARPTGQLSSDSRTQPTPSAANSGDRLVPIRGAKVEWAEFTPSPGRLLQGDQVLLQHTITLTRPGRVYVSGTTSVTSENGGGRTFATGITSDSTSFNNAIKSSLNLVTVPDNSGYAHVSVETRFRLPAGRHVLRWMVRSPGAQLKFGAGGNMSIRVFPATDQ